MKKYIIGAIAGFMLSLGVGAHAEVVNMIDQVVQGMFPVSVNGQALGDAIVVDNKTYLPVREFGEAVGYAVTFTDAREVILTKNDAKPSPTPTPSAEPTTTIMTKEQKIDAIKSKMTMLVPITDMHKDLIEKQPDSPFINLWKELVAKNEKELADLQTQLDALLAQP